MRHVVRAGQFDKLSRKYLACMYIHTVHLPTEDRKRVATRKSWLLGSFSPLHYGSQ